jgi:hypothetical protein
MPNGLTAADREEFIRRLSKYGLNEQSVIQPELVVLPSTKIKLTWGGNISSFREPLVLRTRDLADVKRWVGIPDTFLERGGSGPRVSLPRTLPTRLVPTPQPSPIATQPTGTTTAPRPLSAVLRPTRGSTAEALARPELSSLTTTQLAEVPLAARAYIFGNSKLVAKHKPVVEAVLGIIQIPIWPFFTIVVRANSVLEFGPGNHILTAGRLVLEPGAKVRSYGNLNVDCTIIEKQ